MPSGVYSQLDFLTYNILISGNVVGKVYVQKIANTNPAEIYASVEHWAFPATLAAGTTWKLEAAAANFANLDEFITYAKAGSLYYVPAFCPIAKKF